MDGLVPATAAGRRTALKYLALVVVLLALPLASSRTIANQVLVFAVFALGYHFLLGYGGELSFGHAMFIGLGAYLTVLPIVHFDVDLYVAIFVAAVGTTLVALVMGAISLRRRGIYFGMITLALGQMWYFIVWQWKEVTNGRVGFPMPSDTRAALGPFDPLTAEGYEFYAYLLIALVVVWLVVRRLVRSPFGRTLVAIRENEERAAHLGYRTNGYLLAAFAISGLISSVAGALFLVNFQYITPDLLYWTTTGEVLAIVIIGGIGRLDGPVVGAVIFILLMEYLSAATAAWPVFFGIILMVVALYAPDGVYDLVEPVRDWLDGDATIRDRVGF